MLFNVVGGVSVTVMVTAVVGVVVGVDVVIVELVDEAGAGLEAGWCKRSFGEIKGKSRSSCSASVTCVL